MRTAIEVDANGDAIRVFHRTATAAWTHVPGGRYRYRTRSRKDGMNGLGWVEVRCACPRTDEGSHSAPRRAERPLDTSQEAVSALA
jgi:hypothetical protein